MNDLYFPAFQTGGRIVEVDIILKKPRKSALLGLSLECITPGCVPVLIVPVTVDIISILTVFFTAALLTAYLPCVPLHRMQ